MLAAATVCCWEMDGESPVRCLCMALERRGLLTRIGLGPLPPAAAAELAQAAAGRVLSAEQAANLAREAEGNPLFVVEMARAE